MAGKTYAILLSCVILSPLARGDQDCQGDDCPATVNSLLQSGKRAIQSHKIHQQDSEVVQGDSCSGNDCSASVACPSGSSITKCEYVGTGASDGAYINDALECVVRGGTDDPVAPKATCTSGATTSFQVSDEMFLDQQTVSASCPDGTEAISCNCWSAWLLNICNDQATFDPDGNTCSLDIGSSGGRRRGTEGGAGAKVYALCQGYPKDCDTSKYFMSTPYEQTNIQGTTNFADMVSRCKSEYMDAGGFGGWSQRYSNGNGWCARFTREPTQAEWDSASSSSCDASGTSGSCGAVCGTSFNVQWTVGTDLSGSCDDVCSEIGGTCSQTALDNLALSSSEQTPDALKEAYEGASPADLTCNSWNTGCAGGNCANWGLPFIHNSHFNDNLCWGGDAVAPCGQVPVDGHHRRLCPCK